MDKNYFAFLASSRFHATVALMILYYLKTAFGFDEAIADSLIGLLAAHIGIKTIDRASEHIGKK